MRKIILITLIVLTSINAEAQDEYDNFKIENRDVIWQKVFETKLSKEEVITYLKENGNISYLEISDNKLTGQLTKVEADYKGFGKTEMGTTIYIARSFFNAFTIIDFKDNRYRVTLKNIRLIQKYSDALSEEGQKTSLKTYAVKNRKPLLRNSFKGSPSGILNYTFTKIFTATKGSDDW